MRLYKECLKAGWGTRASEEGAGETWTSTVIEMGSIRDRTRWGSIAGNKNGNGGI